MFKESQLSFPGSTQWLVPGTFIRVCSDVAHLAFRFSHFLLPANVAVHGKFDFMRTFLKFGGCLFVQIGVT